MANSMAGGSLPPLGAAPPASLGMGGASLGSHHQSSHQAAASMSSMGGAPASAVAPPFGLPTGLGSLGGTPAALMGGPAMGGMPALGGLLYGSQAMGGPPMGQPSAVAAAAAAAAAATAPLGGPASLANRGSVPPRGAPVGGPLGQPPHGIAPPGPPGARGPAPAGFGFPHLHGELGAYAQSVQKTPGLGGARESPEFNVNDGADFPALPGKAPSPSPQQPQPQQQTAPPSQQQQLLHHHHQQQQQQAAAAAAARAAGGPPPGSHLGLPPQPQPGPPPNAAGGKKKDSSVPVPPSDRFGLLGLLGVIRMEERDVTELSLGIDLTALGLNLNSTEQLHRSFAGPWADGPLPASEAVAAGPERGWFLPPCYTMPPSPRLTPGHFPRMQTDTLFYAFYSMPGDEAQLYAAAELAHRGWYFHKGLRAWIARVPHTEPSVKTDRYERGSFLVFDPNNWSKTRADNFLLEYGA